MRPGAAGLSTPHVSWQTFCRRICAPTPSACVAWHLLLHRKVAEGVAPPAADAIGRAASRRSSAPSDFTSVIVSSGEGARRSTIRQVIGRERGPVPSVRNLYLRDEGDHAVVVVRIAGCGWPGMRTDGWTTGALCDNRNLCSWLRLLLALTHRSATCAVACSVLGVCSRTEMGAELGLARLRSV